MNCPLCSGAAAGVFATWPDFSVLECGACRFRYVDTTAPGYPASAQSTYDEAQIGPLRPWLPHIRRRVRDILCYAQSPATVLDIGCGKGELTLALQQQGFDCAGIDMKPGLIAQLQAQCPQVQWRCAQAVELVQSGERYDVLTLYHVLEHIPDPRRAMAAVKSLARPGALIAIEVPNAGGLEARLKGRNWHYYKVDHVSYFRVRDLLMLAADFGMDVLGVRGYQHFSYPQDVLWKDLVKGALGLIGFKDVVSVFLRVRPGASAK